MPRVSVVIPCFNAEPWIRETINSVLAQGLDDIELIVIDDGSTDRGPELVHTVFPSAHLKHIERQGPSRACNIGTELSTGQFIQYVDADDVLAPGKLALQLETLQRTGAEVAYGRWQKLERSPTGTYELTSLAGREMEHPDLELFTHAWYPPAAYLFRRDIVESVGGWNEQLPIIQDARFALDCALHGGRFVYCPGTMAYYRVHTRDFVSRRDPVAFVRDCLRNAVEIEAWWKAHGGLDEERRSSVLQAYSYVARASFEYDSSTFQAAYNALERLQPGYVPQRPRPLALASRVLGYRRAESLDVWYRRATRLILHVKCFSRY
jgi:glycosyltransferase involved in cell wall biosynthesis